MLYIFYRCAFFDSYTSLNKRCIWFLGFISVMIFSFSECPKLCLNITCLQVVLINKFRITMYYVGSYFVHCNCWFTVCTLSNEHKSLITYMCVASSMEGDSWAFRQQPSYCAVDLLPSNYVAWIQLRLQSGFVVKM